MQGPTVCSKFNQFLDKLTKKVETDNLRLKKKKAYTEDIFFHFLCTLAMHLHF